MAMQISNYLFNNASKLASFLLLGILTTASLNTVQAAPPIHANKHHESQNYNEGYANPNNSNGFLNQEMLGPLLGAAIGGLLGSQFGDGKGKLAATAAGALLGYILAGKFKEYMDNSDRQRANQTLENSQDRHTVSWLNPETQASYAMTPVNTYQTDSGYCRDYITHAKIDNQSEKVQGTACREANGSWLVQN